MAFLNPSIAIGRLRWLVAIARREQDPDPNGTGILEIPKDVKWVRAEVLSFTTMAFWGSMETDRPVTHRIRMRWLDYLDNTYVIYRETKRQWDDSVRVERFRVRRVAEVGGRKRFIEVDCELEQAAD